MGCSRKGIQRLAVYVYKYTVCKCAYKQGQGQGFVPVMKGEHMAMPFTTCLPSHCMCVFEEECLEVLKGISDPWASLRKRLELLRGYVCTYAPLNIVIKAEAAVQESLLLKMHVVASADLPSMPPRPSPHVTFVCLLSSG